MKNVLVLMDSLYNGGAERSLVNFLNELPNDEYNVDLLLLRPNGMFMSQIPGWINLINTPDDVKKLFGNIKSAGKYLPTKIVGSVISNIKFKDAKLADYYRWSRYYSNRISKLDKHYDVALSYTSGNVMYFTAEKVDAEKKYVWVHNDFLEAGYPIEVYKEYYKQFDGVVSISDKCVKIIRDIFPEIKDRVYMIENITSSKSVRSRAEEFIPEEFGKNVFNLVSIGRLDMQKGFDMAIEAASILKSQEIKFKWFFIGTGPMEKQLREQIEKYKLEDVAILLGARENPYPYIKNADIFLQTSRFEGKSVVLDEAKILCAPIIVTNYPTVHDQIDNGKDGMIVEMSPRAIADGIKTLINDDSSLNQMKQYLSDHEYGNQREIEKYRRLIES